MYLFLTDETNFPPKRSGFFIYGGLIIEAARVPELHNAIMKVRAKHGYAAGENLKFSNQAKKDAAVHLAAKTDALEACLNAGAKFVATVVLEQVLRKKSQPEYMGYALNIMTVAYHEFLFARGDDGYGALLIDRVDKREVNSVLESMVDRFQTGLEMPEGYNFVVNDRIVLFGMTSNNASHLSSCADIALGSFRYCVNAATGHENAKPEIAKVLMPSLDKLFWRRDFAATTGAPRLGYRPYPKSFTVEWTGEQYARLARTLASYVGTAASSELN